MTGFQIAGRQLGPGAPCFVIAEAGVNHNGDPAMAHALVDVAADTGADAIKFQTFRADRLATPDAPKAGYQVAAGGETENQQTMLRRLELDDGAWRKLTRHCRQRNITFLSSPFDPASADDLERLGIAAFKVGSGEITNLPFLEHLGGKRRPLILSTGMANLTEVASAVAAVRAAGCRSLALLHCVSAYPASPEDCNLRAMQTLAGMFGAPVGWSDHTMGCEIALAATALGACIIEKHITLDPSLPGPDQRCSMAPAEFAALVTALRRVESALGDGRKQPVAAEADVAAVARKSLVAARDLVVGSNLTPESVASRRPGIGIAPARLPDFLGRRVKRAVAAGTILHPDMFE